MYLATNFSISRVVDSAEILMRLICIKDVNILYFTEVECFGISCLQGLFTKKELLIQQKY